MQGHDQESSYSARAAAFPRVNEWDEQHLPEGEPDQAPAAIGALYDPIPLETRKRAVDNEGVQKMHAGPASLKGRSGRGASTLWSDLSFNSSFVLRQFHSRERSRDDFRLLNDGLFSTKSRMNRMASGVKYLPRALKDFASLLVM